jgi:hypothetical protein
MAPLWPARGQVVTRVTGGERVPGRDEDGWPVLFDPAGCEDGALGVDAAGGEVREYTGGGACPAGVTVTLEPRGPAQLRAPGQEDITAVTAKVGTAGA